MQIRELTIAGAFEVAPVVQDDDRGVFLEWFRADRFEEATGHRFDLAQANCSVSSAGSLRGIHFAQLPPGQAKYVTCLRGAVMDVVVDIRVGSPTYGQWDAVRLDDIGRRAVYLSVGLGHAFLALEDDTVVSYLCSAAYSPGREHAIHPLDPALAIDWPTVDRDGRPLTPVLSEKDAAAPSLDEVRAQGLLPTYDDTRAFIDRLNRRSAP